MIPVTKPFQPPEIEYLNLVRMVFKRNWLTNNGPLINELELRLKDYLHVKHGIIVSNRTIALQIAIKALGMTGKVLTTPFSYVVSASCLAWIGTNAVCLEKIRTCGNVTIEAGSILPKDISEPGVYKGTPAKKLSLY